MLMRVWRKQPVTALNFAWHSTVLQLPQQSPRQTDLDIFLHQVDDAESPVHPMRMALSNPCD